MEAVRDLKTKNGKLTRQLRVAKNKSSALSTLLAEARDDVEKEQRLVRAANALVAGLEEDKKDLKTKVQLLKGIIKDLSIKLERTSAAASACSSGAFLPITSVLLAVNLLHGVRP